MKTRIGCMSVSVVLAISMFFLGVGPAGVTPALADGGECTCCQIDEPPIQDANKAVAIALSSEELHAWRASLKGDGVQFDVGQREVIFLGGDENHHLYRVAFLPNPLPPEEVSGVVIVVDTIAEEVVADARVSISADEGNGRTLSVYLSNGDIHEFPYQHDYSNINWACWADCMIILAPEILIFCCIGTGCPAWWLGCVACLGCTGFSGLICAIACP